jgi:arylsulfatase A-like enzyme
MFEGGGSPWAGAPVSRSMRKDFREMYQQRLESLLSVDEAVGAAVRTLRRTGQLDNTYVILTSDNGFMVGEHNKSGKLVPYDPSLRVPMVIRGPGIPAGVRSSTPTTNPDLAVTIAALAGARPGRDVDGVDMSPYWRKRADFDRPIPIRGYPVQSGEVPMYTGLHEGPWTYVVTRSGREVLFNRDVDRGELKNRAKRKKYAADLVRLRKLEKKYRNCKGKSCPGADTFTRDR